MSRACFALVAIVALMMPAEAGERASHLLDHASLATTYAQESDTVTAYTTAMARFRNSGWAWTGTETSCLIEPPS